MDLLAVFARWPQPGRVKTRLSPALPPELACDLHRAMLADTLDAARASRAQRRWICWAEAPADPAPIRGFEIAFQRGEDLGVRLEAGFRDRLTPAARMVVTGSDAPELQPKNVNDAFDSLASHEVVLGPTLDGGFYLVGLSSRVAGLFDGHPWSTPLVRASVEKRARELGLSVAMLEPLADIDTPADVVALLSRLLGAPAAPATTAALEAMGLLPPSP